MDCYKTTTQIDINSLEKKVKAEKSKVEKKDTKSKSGNKKDKSLTGKKEKSKTIKDMEIDNMPIMH